MRFIVRLSKEDIDAAVKLYLSERGVKAKNIVFYEQKNGSDVYVQTPIINVDLEELPIIKHNTTPYR